MNDKLSDRVAGVLSLGNSAKTLIEYALAGEKALRLLPELLAILDTEGDGGAVELEYPEFHVQGMGCGLEDRGITDRYEAMRYGFDEALDQMARIIENAGPIYTHPARSGVVSEGVVPVAEEVLLTRKLVRMNAEAFDHFAAAMGTHNAMWGKCKHGVDEDDLCHECANTAEPVVQHSPDAADSGRVDQIIGAELERAWFAICDALSEIDPDWMMYGPVGVEAAVAKIHALAAQGQGEAVAEVYEYPRDHHEPTPVMLKGVRFTGAAVPVGTKLYTASSPAGVPDVVGEVMAELEKAIRKFPTWPTDPLLSERGKYGAKESCLRVHPDFYGTLQTAMLAAAPSAPEGGGGAE